jgi:hypothetical protein
MNKDCTLKRADYCKWYQSAGVCTLITGKPCLKKDMIKEMKRYNKRPSSSELLFKYEDMFRSREI